MRVSNTSYITIKQRLKSYFNTHPHYFPAVGVLICQITALDVITQLTTLDHIVLNLTLIFNLILVYLLSRPFSSNVTQLIYRTFLIVLAGSAPLVTIALFYHGSASIPTCLNQLIMGTLDPLLLIKLLILYVFFALTLIIFIFIHYAKYYISLTLLAVPSLLLILSNNQESAYTKQSILIILLFVFFAFSIKSNRAQSIINTSRHLLIVFFIALIPVIILTGKFSDKKSTDFFNRVAARLEYHNYLLFGKSQGGFSQTEQVLGGPVTPLDNVEFFITGVYPRYLRGQVRHFYSGRSWRITNTLWKREKEVIPAVSISNQSLVTHQIMIEPKSLLVSLFLAPLQTKRLTHSSAILKSNDATYKPENGLTITTAYTIIYEKKTFSDTPYNFTYNIIEDNSIRRNLRIKYRRDLQLPKEITQRTRTLAKLITADSRSNKETLDQINYFLTSKYEYSYNSSYLPPDAEFVDLFLFKDKFGYCTHFATAAIVLLRLNGIPARYVEGFSIPSKLNNDERFMVRSNMAHAWCEILVDHKNDIWEVFDPTPFTYYQASQDSHWKQYVYDYLKKNNEMTPTDDVTLQNKLKQYTTGSFSLNEPSLAKKLHYIYFAPIILVLLLLIATSFRLIMLLYTDDLTIFYRYTVSILISTGIVHKESFMTAREQLMQTKNCKLSSAALDIINAYYAETFSEKKVYHNRLRLFIRLMLTLLLRDRADSPFYSIKAFFSFK